MILIIALGVFVVLSLAVGGFMYYRHSSSSTTPSQPQKTIAPTTTPSPADDINTGGSGLIDGDDSDGSNAPGFTGGPGGPGVIGRPIAPGGPSGPISPNPGPTTYPEFIGRQYGAQLEQDIRSVAGDNVRIVRLPPNSMIDASYRSDRIQVRVDANNIVLSVRRG
jgi:hypothetical protein